MQQSYRMQTLAKFKNNEIKILVCSDVAARGLDIQGLSHVFLYDVPIHAEDYVHRIGRTGRAGMPGRALTLAAPEDGKFLDAVERLIGKPIPRFDPDGQRTETPPAPEQAIEPVTDEQVPEPATGQDTDQASEFSSEPAPDTAPEPVAGEPVAEAAIAPAVQVTEDATPAEPATEAAPSDSAETEERPKREGRRRNRGGRGRGSRDDGKTEAREEAKDDGAPDSGGKEQPTRGRNTRVGGRKRSEGRGEGRGRRQGGKRDGQRDGRGHMPAFLNQGTGRKKKSDK
jgi:superfamily II DNA/RNA helicase